MSLIKRFLIFPLLSLLMGCTILSLFDGQEDMAAFPAWVLPEKPVSVMQLVKADYQGRDQAFQAAINMNEDHMTLAVMDGLGNRALTLNWTKDGVTVQKSAQVPESLKIKDILADLMLVYWPADQLDFMDFVFVDGDHGRKVKDKEGGVVAIITYEGRKDRWTGQALLDNQKYDYRIKIKSRLIGVGQ